MKNKKAKKRICTLAERYKYEKKSSDSTHDPNEIYTYVTC